MIDRIKTTLLAGSMLAGLVVLPSAALAQTASPTNTPTDPSVTDSPTASQPTTPAELGSQNDASTGAVTGPSQTTPAPQPGQTSSGGSVEGIVVTGSRIRRTTEFNSPDPIQVITAEQATLQGFADTGALLQNSSIASGSFQTNTTLTGFVNTGGPGAKTISLRGLGDNRTLVLLNGKRLGPAGTRGQVGQVDLNTIPESSIDHIDILKDGASSLYGSDAVAGVVNIITKNKTNGGSIQIYGNTPVDGAGETYKISGEWGHRFGDRGFINLGAEYFRQEPLRRRDRENTNCAEDYLFTPDQSARIDFTTPYANNGHLYKCYNIVNNTIDVNQLNANGSATALGRFQYLQPGVSYPTAAQGNNVPAALAGIFARQARNGYPLTFPYANYDTGLFGRATVLSPQTNYSLNANGGFNITPDVEAYGEFLFNRRESNQSGVRQYFPALGLAFRTNPNNIFAGTNYYAVQPIIPAQSDTSQTVDYFRGVGGIRGKFSNLGYLDRFNFDVYGAYSKSDATYSQDIIYNDRSNAITRGTACNQALITISGTGGECATIPNGIPLLSPRVLAGQFTDAERAFLFGREGGSTVYDQYLVEASINGDLFNLPAGPVGFAGGVDYRHDSIDDNPDRDIALNNLYGQTSAGRTKGTDAVKEAFGELEIPLLKNLPGFQSFTLTTSGRYTDYDSYGGGFTYKHGLNWQIIPDIRVRATYGTSFRAPALYEQYLANQTGFLAQSQIDPCYNFGSANGLNPLIPQRCAALGIAPDYNGVINGAGGSSALISTGGGRGILTAETSLAKTAGIIFTPQFIKPVVDLNVAVDYFDLAVRGEVAQFGAGNIITQCLTSPNYPNDPFCTLFTRDPVTHNILTVKNNYVNVASQRVRGIDLTIRATKDFGQYGKLTANSALTWTLGDKTALIGGAPVQDLNGTTYANRGPDFTGTANLIYDIGDWTIFYGARIYGKGSDTELDGGDVFPNARYANIPNGITSQSTYYKQYVEFTVFHDISVRKRFVSLGLDAELGVQNITGEYPPSYSTGQGFRVGVSATPGPYDLAGRRVFATVTKKF